MRTRVVVCGDSYLALAVAQVLDQTLAREPSVECLYFSRAKEFVYLNAVDSLFTDHWPTVNKARPLSHFKPIQARPKTINLNTQVISFASKEVPYDYLLLDLTPTWGLNDLKILQTELKKLLFQAQAAQKTRQSFHADIHFTGGSADSYQLGLLLTRGLQRQNQALMNYLSVTVDRSPDPALTAFLADHQINVGAVKTHQPGMVVHQPLGIIAPSDVKGLTIDRTGQPTIDHYPAVNPTTFIVGGRYRDYQNMLRPNQVLSQELVRNWRLAMENRSFRALDLLSPAFLLVGNQPFAKVGTVTNQGLRAQAIEKLERAAWRRLTT